MKRRPYHRGLVTTLIFSAFVLSACAQDKDVSFDLRPLTAEEVGTMLCEEARAASEAVDEADRAPEESGKHRQLDELIPEGSTLEEVQTALDARVQEICTNETAPATATDSPTSSSSPTTGTEDNDDEEEPTPDPTSTATATGLGWKAVFDEPPAGLKEMVESNSGLLGWNWASVKTWAEDGRDARVVLAFGSKAPDLAAARKTAGVGVIPVVHVETCASLSEQPCPKSGVIVVLAPVDEDDGRSLATGTAVWVNEDGASVLYDLAGTQVVPED